MAHAHEHLVRIQHNLSRSLLLHVSHQPHATRVLLHLRVIQSPLLKARILREQAVPTYTRQQQRAFGLTRSEGAIEATQMAKHQNAQYLTAREIGADWKDFHLVSNVRGLLVTNYVWKIPLIG